MSGSLVRTWILVLLCAAAAYGGFSAYRHYKQSEPEPLGAGLIELDTKPRPLTGLNDVTLVERSGANFKFASLNGQVWVADSFYTSCQLECAMLTAVMRSLQNEFPELRLVSITSNPIEDTAEVLKERAKGYGADASRWFFLTGKPLELQTTTGELFSNRKLGKDHSKYITLVDRDGNWVSTYDGTSQTSVDELREKIREMLRKA